MDFAAWCAAGFLFAFNAACSTETAMGGAPQEDVTAPVETGTDDILGDVSDADDLALDQQLGDLPENNYCAQVEQWADEWVLLELRVIDLVNQRRSEGADCGSGGSFGPAGALSADGALTCAARNHAMDMALRNFFNHTNPDGDGPGVRIELTEYDYRTWGENIAAGHASPEAVMEGWMNSSGHCANIMNASFTEIGVGFHDGNYWVQVFGTPR
jgi:uncharacterized protein YkwD